MPLDTSSTYSSTLLRQDGRRWNELRKFSTSISTQPSADGSSLVTMGNTSVVCTVTGPREGRGQGDRNNALVETEINVAPFAQLDRRRAGRTDKRVQELQTTISQAFQSHLFTHLYPRSSILLSLTVLSLDGGLLAACLNAASIALVDAGVPMPSILAAISSGTIIPNDNSLLRPEPLLDLNNAEEQELPFLSLATVRGEAGSEDKISVLLMESRVQVSDSNKVLEIMLKIGLDGCAQVRSIIEDVIRKHGLRVMQGRRASYSQHEVFRYERFYSCWSHKRTYVGEICHYQLHAFVSPSRLSRRHLCRSPLPSLHNLSLACVSLNHLTSVDKQTVDPLDFFEFIFLDVPLPDKTASPIGILNVLVRSFIKGPLRDAPTTLWSWRLAAWQPAPLHEHDSLDVPRSVDPPWFSSSINFETILDLDADRLRHF